MLAGFRVTGEAMHLFEVHEHGRYLYRGSVEFAGESYQAQQRDSNLRARTVWIFPLRLTITGATGNRDE
jgi:hypothetical protein